MTSRANGMNDSEQQVISSGMIPKPPQHVVTIADDDALAAFEARMQQAPWLAVDTEFRRERTYYPQLCLVQIAGNDEIGLVDVLAIESLEPLTRLMGEHGPPKVFHAADQDIEVLYQALGTLPAPLFDTQVAAALSGHGDQLGYARLVEQLTGVALAKAHTRTDWSQRPLSQQMLAYAADDVRHLAVIYPLLQARLQQLERLDWVGADCAALASPERLQPNPDAAWQRLRGWQYLEPHQQQALAALASWREHQAMHADRPRKWILSDDALFALARQQPHDQDALHAIKALPQKTAKRHGPALLAALTEAAQRPAEPLADTTEPLDNAQKKLCKQARQALAVCARDSDIAAPVLARRKDLERLVLGQRDLAMLRGWRFDVAGRAILDVVEGRRRVVGKGDDAQLVGAE